LPTQLGGLPNHYPTTYYQEGVMPDFYSKMLKARGITYFFDVKEAKNQTKYLTITASQPSQNGDKKFVKRSIRIFSDTIEEFGSTVKEAIENMK